MVAIMMPRPVMYGLFLFALHVNLFDCETTFYNEYQCNRRNCRLPNCRCASTDIPGGLHREQTPQMVIFTLDDVISGKKFYDDFNSLFVTDDKNPNACPLSVTFFASQSAGFDSCVMDKLNNKGHEVAAYSVDQRTSKGWWKAADEKDWRNETKGFKTKLTKKNLDDKIIKGWRTPFLIAGGDVQFKALKDAEYLYDSTLITDNKSSTEPALWPFTLDYGVPLECENQNCSEGSYPGLWEVPVQIHSDIDDMECLFLDRCINPPKNDEELFDMFWKNFKKHYEKNRAPVIFSLQVAWLIGDNKTMDGFKRFVKELNKIENVYIVSIAQMLDWVKDPTPLDKLIYFAPWQCHFRSMSKVVCSYEYGDLWLDRYWWLEIPILTLIFLILYKRDQYND